MKKVIIWIFVASVALAALGILTFPVYTDSRGISGIITKADNEIKQVGIAVELYAKDHQGRLPQSLDELAPAYLPDKAFFPHIHLTTPHAVLAELPPDSIIMFRVATDDHRRETRVLVVHPDISLEWKRP